MSSFSVDSNPMVILSPHRACADQIWIPAFAGMTHRWKRCDQPATSRVTPAKAGAQQILATLPEIAMLVRSEHARAQKDIVVE